MQSRSEVEEDAEVEAGELVTSTLSCDPTPSSSAITQTAVSNALVFMAGMTTNAACSTMPLHLLQSRQKERRQGTNKRSSDGQSKREDECSEAPSLSHSADGKVNPTSRLLPSCCHLLSHAVPSQPVFSVSPSRYLFFCCPVARTCCKLSLSKGS